jgi:hypothetical protein
VLAVIEREVTPEQPVGFDYVLVHKPLIPKAD